MTNEIPNTMPTTQIPVLNATTPYLCGLYPYTRHDSDACAEPALIQTNLSNPLLKHIDSLRHTSLGGVNFSTACCNTIQNLLGTIAVEAGSGRSDISVKKSFGGLVEVPEEFFARRRHINGDLGLEEMK